MRLGVLRLEAEGLEDYRRSCGFATSAAALQGLGEALAAQPLLSRQEPQGRQTITVVARLLPEPVLAILGEWSAAEQARLEAQARAVAATCSVLRYVDAATVREGVEELATALEGALGRATLARCRFVGIPRGGTIVLGWLAYALGLEPGQLKGALREERAAASGTPEDPWIAVDDCALTGSRFQRFVAGCDRPPLAFAHLFSTPGLRQTLEQAAAGPLRCVAARDLEDLSAGWPEARREEWNARWSRQGPRNGVWCAATEPLCFPWAEPDRWVWEGAGEESLRAWKVVPPSHCLANTPPPGAAVHRLFVQPPAPALNLRSIEPAHSTLWCIHRQRAVLADLDSGRCFTLDAVATAMWCALWELPSLTEAAAVVAQQFSAPVDQVLRDVEGFCQTLTQRGLLAPRAA